MRITTVCSYCRGHDNDPILEFNFREGKIYYICKECKKESVINLKAEGKPLPRTRRM